MDLKHPAPPRLLVMTSSAADTALLDSALRDSSLSAATIEHEPTMDAGLKRLANDWFDGVLLTLDDPEHQGLEPLTRVCASAGRAAVVVITESDDVHLAEEAFRLGTQDCLTKSSIRPAEFGRAVGSAIRRQRVLHEMLQARDEQISARDQFLSHVSHELRSPLSVVHQFASLLIDGIGGPLTTDQQDLMAVLMRNTGQLKVMIDDLLEVTRPESGRLRIECRALEICELLTETAAAYRPRAVLRHVHLAIECSDLPTVLADAERLREVLANLLDNALKFTPDGGRITVEATQQADMVHVTVRDTGCGIRPEDEDRIFQQFVQVERDNEASRDGLGLGLYICRDLVERQGGVIWVASKFGSGTAVTFTIPILNRHNAATIRR